MHYLNSSAFEYRVINNFINIIEYIYNNNQFFIVEYKI